MNRLLLGVVVGLALLVLGTWWGLDHVTTERDAAVTQAKKSDAAAASLRVTLRLQRELATDQVAIETTYLKEKQRAEDYADSLRRCLADGTCGLRVAATCPVVRDGGAGAAAGQPDAATPELTAAARRAYPDLVAGLWQQRAQITGLQAELTTLHGKCKIGATP